MCRTSRSFGASDACGYSGWMGTVFDLAMCVDPQFETKQSNGKHTERWWKKSCTSWDVKSLLNTGINYLSAGAGFLQSTVCKHDGPFAKVGYFPKKYDLIFDDFVCQIETGVPKSWYTKKYSDYGFVGDTTFGTNLCLWRCCCPLVFRLLLKRTTI